MAGLKVKVTAVPLLVGHLGLAHNTTQHNTTQHNTTQHTTPDSSSFCLFTTLAAAMLLLYHFTFLGITSVSE